MYSLLRSYLLLTQFTWQTNLKEVVMKQHWMNAVRTAILIILVAVAAGSITGCEDPFKNMRIPIFGQ
jgi:hypothetical protein